MATYAEMHGILTDTTPGAQTLRDKVGVACLIAAQTIAKNEDTASPPWATGGHDQRVKWVTMLLTSYAETTRRMFAMVVAGNAAATQAQILGATDAVLQTEVNKAVDVLAANLP